MPTEWLGLKNDYEAQADAAPPGDGPVYPADEIDRLHSAVDSQLSLTIENTPIGVLWNPDRTSLQVAAGTGRSVTIQPGRAKVLHSTYGPAQIELTGVLTLTNLEPSSTKYIFVAIDVTVDNDSRATAQPKFTVQAGNTLDGGVLLARVVVGASTITSVTEGRVPVRFQDVDIHGQDIGTSIDPLDEFLIWDVSAGKNVRVTKSLLDSSGYSSASISANQNNYSTGDYPVLRLTSDASRNITGLIAVSKKVLTIVNVGAQNIVLQNQNASSTAANRIIVPSGTDLTLLPNYASTLWYDDVTTRWRVLYTWATGGGGAALTVFNAQSESEAATDSIEFKNSIVDATGSGNVTVQSSLTFTNEAALAAYAATLTGGVLPDGIDIVLTAPTGIYQPQPRTITANTTVLTTDSFIFVDATAGAVTVTLLSAASATHEVGVKKKDVSANTVTVLRAGSDTVDGGTSKVISAQWESYYFASDGVSLWGVF